MPSITMIHHDGARQSLDAASGHCLMEAARERNVPGIKGECGGSLACGTCHVYVDDAWSERLRKPDSLERDMIEGLTNASPNSRLSCQIVLTDALDGLVVYIPPESD